MELYDNYSKSIVCGAGEFVEPQAFGALKKICIIGDTQKICVQQGESRDCAQVESVSEPHLEPSNPRNLKRLLTKPHDQDESTLGSVSAKEVQKVWPNAVHDLCAVNTSVKYEAVCDLFFMGTYLMFLD